MTSRAYIKTALKLLVPIIILAWLFHTLDTAKIFGCMAKVDLTLFFLSFGILCVRNIIGAWRGSIILRHRHHYYPVHRLAKYYFIGNFFNLFLPEVIGRDIARGYYLYNTGSDKSETVGSIVAERYIGTAALFFLSLSAIPIAGFIGADVFRFGVIRGITVIFAVFAVVSVLLLNGATDRFLERLSQRYGLSRLGKAVSFARTVIAYCTSPSLVAVTFLISVIFQFTGVVGTFLIARALGDTTGFIYFLIILPMIWVIGMAPVSINGLGIREGSFVILFGAVGMADETAMAISLLWFVQNIGLGIIGGLLLAFGKKEQAGSSVENTVG